MSLDARALEAQRNRLLAALDHLVDAYDLVDDEESSIFLRAMARRNLERSLEDARQVLSFLKGHRKEERKIHLAKTIGPGLVRVQPCNEDEAEFSFDGIYYKRASKKETP